MISVKVGELRNHLSKYLKRVRQGMEVLINDRDTPIGRLVPYNKGKKESLELIPPKRNEKSFAKFSGSDIELSVDPVQLLLEDRQKR